MVDLTEADALVWTDPLDVDGLAAALRAATWRGWVQLPFDVTDPEPLRPASPWDLDSCSSRRTWRRARLVILSPMTSDDGDDGCSAGVPPGQSS